MPGEQGKPRPSGELLGPVLAGSAGACGGARESGAPPPASRPSSPGLLRIDQTLSQTAERGKHGGFMLDAGSAGQPRRRTTPVRRSPLPFAPRRLCLLEATGA